MSVIDDFTDWIDGPDGRNAVPGDAAGIRSVGNNLNEMADMARHSGNRLRQIKNGELDSVWQGAASDAFTENIELLPADLRKLELSLEEASSAIFLWADTVDRLQDDAERQTRQKDRAHSDKANAVAARDREIAALVSESLYDPVGGFMDAVAGDRLRPYNDRVDDTTADLRRARNSLERTRDEAESMARRVASMLDEASALGIQNKSTWEKLGDFFRELGEALLVLITFLDELLELISPVLNLALTIIAIVAPPPVNAAAAAAMFALAAAGLHLTLARAGLGLLLHGETDVTLGEVAWEAAGVGFAAVGFKAVSTAGKALLRAKGVAGAGYDIIEYGKAGIGLFDGTTSEKFNELVDLTFELDSELGDVGDAWDNLTGIDNSDDIAELPDFEAPEPPPEIIDPIDPGPVDPGPIDPGPIDPGPVDPGPVDPGPVDPGPIDPGTGGGGGDGSGKWVPIPESGSGGGGGGGGTDVGAGGGSGEWVPIPESGSDIADFEVLTADSGLESASGSDSATPTVFDGTESASIIDTPIANTGGSGVAGPAIIGGAVVGLGAAGAGAKRVHDKRAAEQRAEGDTAAPAPWLPTADQPEQVRVVDDIVPDEPGNIGLGLPPLDIPPAQSAADIATVQPAADTATVQPAVDLAAELPPVDVPTMHPDAPIEESNDD